MKSDIVIAGGGIIGLYNAYLLAQRGVKSTLIDKGNFGKESTWAAGGILTPLLPWDYKEDIHFLTRNASESYKDLAVTLLEQTQYDIEHWQCGLTVYSSNTNQIQQWCQQNHTLYKVNGTHPTQVHLSNIAQVRTPILIKALIKLLDELGITLLQNTSVQQCDVKDNKVVAVHTSAGKITTSNLVWATGAWSPTLNSSQIPLKTPNIKPIRGQMIAIKNSPVNLSHILFRDDHYLIPRKDGLILAGSTLEDVGFENTTTEEAKQQLWEKSLELIPELSQANITHHWSGLRPGSNSNIPTIGPHPEVKGLFYNCGHFRYGIAMAPKACEILTHWILNDSNRLNAQEKSYACIN